MSASALGGTARVVPISRNVWHERVESEQTLRVWFHHDMKIASAAAALGIHRNSLDYRLSRVQEICRCDLSRIDDIFELYFALNVGGNTRDTGKA